MPTDSLIPIFDGENYDYWCVQMRTLFISQNLWDIVQNGYEEPASPDEEAIWTEARKKTYKEKVLRHAQALLNIQRGISKTIFPRIVGMTKSKDAWDILRTEFKGYDKVISIKLQTLWRDFDNLSMRENESIREFFSRVAIIVNQIRSYGDEITDQKVVEKVLKSLPLKFEHVVAVIEESKDLTKLTRQQLMSSLEAHEQRMSRFSSQPMEQAFQSRVQISKSSNEYANSSRGQRQGRFKKERGEQNQSNNGDRRNDSGKSDSYCIICKKNNHASKDCRFKCKRCKIPNHSGNDCWFKNKNTKASISEEKGE